MSAANLLLYPVAKWTHACSTFTPSTKGSPRWCATCSFARAVHKRRHAVMRDASKVCPLCGAQPNQPCTPVIKPRGK